MTLKEAIYTRRSIRNYTSKAIDKECVQILIDAAVQAPSAMNSQPWAFSVIQDGALLKNISDKSKELLLSQIHEKPLLEKYRSALESEEFNIFYNAGTLVTVYAKPEGPCPEMDCGLAAQNLMLEAHALGLGTCWIGFSQNYLDTPESKKAMGVPADYSVVACIIVGHPAVPNVVMQKKAPEVLFWK